MNDTEYSGGADLVRVKAVLCPNCGANIKADPKSKTLKCEFCGSSLLFEYGSIKLDSECAREEGSDLEKDRIPAQKEELKSHNGRKTGRLVLFASVLTAVMSALAVVLMKLEISVPIMPAFIKFDFSDFPAMFAGIAAGPLWGVLVCLIKNLLHIFFGSSTGGIGEIANFAIGAAYVLTATLIYRRIGGRKGMLIGGAAGSVAMAVVAYPVNLFIVYPLYTKFMPLQSIIDAYSAINPAVTGLPQALLIFNTPFNVIKGVILTAVAILTYSVTKPLFELIEDKIRS